jgi:hypothetical protein
VRGPPTRRRLVRRQCAGAVLGCALLTGLFAGCTTARSSLGTSDSSCYLALTTATRAVGAHGHLLGVQSYSLSTLRKQAPSLIRDVATKEPGSASVCVIAFTGRFSAGSVSDPRGRTSGRLAVVITTKPGNHLLGTVIFTHAPLHFGHSHAG